MSERELIDTYDDAGRPTGVVERAVAHRDGLWHRAVHVWLVTAEGALVVQRRSAEKRHWPGLLDVSAAGHILAGESWTAGLREADEELGVTLAAAQVIDAGERREVLHLPGMLDREIVRTAVARCGQPLERYRLGSEVSAVIAIDLDDAEALFRSEGAAARCRAVTRTRSEVVAVSAGDFVARPPEYYLAVVDRARRVVDGAHTARALPDVGT
jgi:isopentenyldiphosphate isomerase